MYNVVSSYLFHCLFVSNICAISYVQDTETTLYYLQSRYYDPELGRFINADALVSTGQGILGNNMFAYCLNNPVNYIDAAGLLPSWNNIQQTVEEIFDEISDYWDRHANRNDEQDEYLEKLKKQCGSEKAMLEYTETHWEAQPWYLNIFHMNIFSSQGFDAFSNVKYLSPDGKYEVIICNPGTDEAYIVTSSVNKGTMNYNTDGGWGHTWQDVAPYFVFGNEGYGLWGDFVMDMVNVISGWFGD